MNENLHHKIKSLHQSNYKSDPLLIMAPGRANIIGEHTDYNKGLALPFAINKYVTIAISTNSVRTLDITAHDIDDTYVSEIANLQYQSKGWARYFTNVLVALNLDLNHGLNVSFGGNLPIGIGVSSSSAITCGFVYGLNHLLKLSLSTDQQIEIASKAENGIGLNGGKMDQIAIYKSKKNSAIYINFGQNTQSEVPLDLDNHSFYLIESGQRHSLVETKYNERRSTCESAFKKLKKELPQITTFADVSNTDILNLIADVTTKNRCLHVVNEFKRVEAAKKSILKKDFATLGRLMTDTHYSLSQLYEVSTPEIDWLVEHTLKSENIMGSRIMGGGFGGCTINLCRGTISETDKIQLTNSYKKSTGLDLKLHMIVPSEGISTI